ncbi:MAG: hypothetical protein KBT47_02545, partial [Armatimonadetes bacterium]|nr:hypothetical protein [Candidatus Hippobium faecium]
MKLFLIFSLVVFCAVCYAAGVQNKNISVELTDTGNNNLVFSKIENIKTGVNFITSPDDKNSLWTITMRKGVKAESEIILKPQDSEKAIVENKKDTVKITWTNVRNNKMKGSVDVIVTGRLEGDNSYWKIRSVNNSDYGYWSVNFPNVTNIHAAKENLLTNPNYGGRFEKGLEEDYDFPFPSLFVTMQWQMVTKNNTTLYMATEDTRAITKQFSCKKTSPDNMKFSVSLNPENMGVAVVDYEQPYEVNISAFEGDWYDGCKKYRKWGIENKYANFGKGKIEDRKDLPQRYKELPVWLRQEGFTEVQISRIIDFAKYLDVPVASHTYYWSQYGFDTHYPNILPAQDIYIEQIKRMHDANIKVMPYTNG